MPSFNFSGLGGSQSSSNYGYLLDQLDMKENQLASDGKLTPGDYQLLTKQAQTAYSNPGLTPEQRSKLQVKISSYQKESKVTGLKDDNDLTKLGNEVQDDFKNNAMLFGNNPQAMLQANADALRLKADHLASSIDSLDASGDDSSAHLNEYNKTLQDYQDMLSALDAAKNYKPGAAPQSDYAAYVTTNEKGEVSDVKVGRVGSQNGYLETSGVYGGLPLYGKVNRKDGGKNVFVIGNKTFSAADYLIPGPDGTMKPSVLTDSSQQTGGSQYKQGVSTPVDIDLKTVRTQSSVPVGGYAQGSNGFLYRRNDDGKYTKYTNVDPKKLGIDENKILQIPSGYEKNIIMPSVSQTIDGAPPISAPVSSSTVPAVGGGATSTQQLPQSTQQPAPDQGGVSRTRSPISRAASTVEGVAASAFSKATGFLGSLFGRK